MGEITLSTLEVGKWGSVGEIALTGSIRRRLQELGFVRGTPVQSLYDAPSGSPRAFGIRGAVIALRRDNAREIFVRPLPEEDPARPDSFHP